MKDVFIKKVFDMYEFENNVLQHIATIYDSAKSDEEFISGLDTAFDGFEDIHDSLLMLRKHLFKSPEYLRRITARPSRS